MPWRPCNCRDGCIEHAHVTMTDSETGLEFNVRVPHQHRGTRLGWGKKPRVRWTAEDGTELEGVRRYSGHAGITALTEDGQKHKLRWGQFTSHDHEGNEIDTELDDNALPTFAETWVEDHHQVEPLKKAKDLKPGQRWITVHPNGKDEKGVPVLIQEGGDGSWRVIGGAGGKLTHLRLTGIKSEEEYKAQAKEKAKERREKEKERKAALTSEAAEKEKKTKDDIEAAKLLAERDYIRKVREKAGGVSEDLDESRLIGLSEGAKNLILTRHHKKQLREAESRKDEFVRKLVEDKADEQHANSLLRAAVTENPAVEEKARELAEMDMALKHEEDEERKAERRLRKQRQVSGQSKVGKRAAEAIAESIENAPDAVDQIVALGVPRTASEEVERRSLEALKAAQRMHEAAKTGEVKGKDLDEVLQKAGVDAEAEPEAAKEVLQKEAARQMRRHEVQAARAGRFRELETEQGPEAAYKALAYSDCLGGIAQSAAEAKKLGLTDSEKTPLQAAEIAEMMEVLEDAQKLRNLRKEYRSAKKAAEAGDYDRSRRAFDLKPGDVTGEVMQTIREKTQRELTERLLGIANPKRSAHLQSVANAHYDAIADIGLGVAGQRYLDRPTVDAIGLKNASLLTRFAMEADGHDPGAMLQALEEVHVGELEKITSDALAKANEYAPNLSATVEDVGDIEKAMLQMDVHQHDLDDAQRAVGSALGKMEATATMGQVFRERVPEVMTVKGGESGDLQGTLQWLHSVGLKPEDYEIDYGEKEVHIPKGSWEKLVNRMPQEEVQRRQQANEIKAGKHDEEGWLPAGIVSREDSSFTNPTPDAPRFFEPLDLSRGTRLGLEDHIGSRLAEGEHPRSILSDLFAPANVDAAPDREDYIATVKDLVPLLDDQGKAVKYEKHAEHFQGLAERYMMKRHGSELGAFHAQDLDTGSKATHEAMFRALAEHPSAVAAFAPPGQLNHEQKRALRDHFYERMGIDPKKRVDEARFRTELDKVGPEPPKFDGTMSLFGGGGPSAEWKEWRRERDAVLNKYPRAGLSEAIKALGTPPREGTGARTQYDQKVAALKEAASKAPTAWERFVEAHGSLELAQRALQDEIKGRFVQSFRDHHGKISGQGLRLGAVDVTNRERHVKATATYEEQEQLRAEARRLMATLRKRIGGRFAAEGAGAVKAKHTTFLEQETVARQNQGSMFTAKQLNVERKEPTPGTGERHSLGERAESQLASLMGKVGAQFQPGKKIGLFSGLNMDGDRVHQQRVIKMMESNGGRLGAWLGTGSGKSLISIGAFTHHHDKGDAKHGLYLVPVAVQDQFGAEMLRFTEPGKYRWDTGSGKSHAERVEMLRNPDLHMRVMTHQSFRDTALKLMADHHGTDVEGMKEKLRGASSGERAKMMRAAFDANDIPKHFVYEDEAHGSTHREGTQESSTNLVMGSISHPENASHYLAGTATPHKNDESEVYSMASRLDPEKYADRHEFMQSFGADMGFNPDAVRRELSHLTYSARIDPEGVDRTDSDNPRIIDGEKVAADGPIKLTGAHKARVDRVGQLYQRARKAWQKGEADVEAIRELSPGRFAGRPRGEWQGIARQLAPSMGVMRETAMRRAINQAPPEQNQKLQQLTSVVQHDLQHATWTDRKGQEQKGKPSIVFTDSLAEARLVHKHLSDQGVRSALYHGGLNHKERDAIRLGFQPEAGGTPKHDVVVATSAAEAGINMQRAKVLHHYDVPQTEKSHAQRSGRAYRQGQQGDVDVHNWHTDAEYETAARRRLRRKEGLASVFQTPIANLDETGVAGAYQRALERKHQAKEVA